MNENKPVGKFEFGSRGLFGHCSIFADSTGKFTLQLSNNEWNFDLQEISRLDDIFAEAQNDLKTKKEWVFWRTNGSKVIQAVYEPKSKAITLIEGGNQSDIISLKNDLPKIRDGIRILTSDGSPYGRSIKLLSVTEQGKIEEIIAAEQIPLNNRNSKTPLVIERELTREYIKNITTETSYGIGYDYYIALNLQRKYGLSQSQKLVERITIRMEALPNELKIYKVIWKEVWRTGYAEFDFGNHREKVPFKLKSSLEPEIQQETLI